MKQEVVRLWLLGGFRMSVGSRAVASDRWRLTKAENLIKLLALAPRHRLHREQVMDTLWPDIDAKHASNNLHRTLHFARGVLESEGADVGSDYLALRKDLLELCPDGPIWIDVEAFEKAAASARMSGAPASFRAAISLYAGELVPENLYEEWAYERRESLRHLYKALLVELGALYEERDEYEKGIQTLRSAVAQEPTDEDAHAGLMRLYALSGRRPEALRQYERLRKTLTDKLDIHPTGASVRLYEQIRSGERPERHRADRPSAAPPPNNLPASLTSFVGREDEVLEVKRSLAMTRVMTLTGAGGSGKTRLALEVARDLVGTYPEGVWLVELAALSDPTLVARAVAATLGVREQPDRSLTQTLRGHIGSGRMLLVLDNCEHLVDAAAWLAKDLLGACPELRVLATSREPLRVSGEIVWPVPTLSLPDPETALTVDDLMGSEAVRLFVDRARSRLPAFELTRENARSVAAICLKLDGIPLAIELSTARMGALAVEQVAERLEDSLKLLTGGDRTVAHRHQTLRATLDWSYELLSRPEQVLFRRLSVFAGGWTLDAAEVVGAGEGIQEDDVLDLLSQLVNKSMVVVDSADGSGLRYRMLEPVRRYGLERFGASGEADAVRRRHACWYFELCKEVEPWLRGARHEVWLEQLEREYGNLRAALSWALERGEVDLGLWFGAALGESWYMSGNLSEGRRWLEAALSNSGDAPPTPSRIKALLRAGWIAWEQGDYESSVAMSEESLMLSREFGDEAGTVAALSNLGWAALLVNDLQKASALAEEAVTLGSAMDDTGGIARALLIPGLTAVAGGDQEQAIALHEESLALARKAGDDVAESLSLGMGVFAYLGQGDIRRAKALCEQSLALPPQPRVMNATSFQLHASAALASSQGLPLRSARLWGAAAALRENIGASLSPVELRVYRPYIEAARQQVGETAWEEAWAEGKAMTVEQAEEYAVTDKEARARPRRVPREVVPGKQSDDGLTGREWEVAHHVAAGLTNRQIASKLTISENTVANHVASIARKLNVPSRSRIAVWVTQRELREVG
ncbi:MAG TPA: BTAD domain-containing putative transcriptional regulator [Rubrobacter sp.]|nr:BTAD domain-containing putative transcriptional regulator [Rubrobacter sp.]